MRSEKIQGPVENISAPDLKALHDNMRLNPSRAHQEQEETVVDAKNDRICLEGGAGQAEEEHHKRVVDDRNLE
jgi:hypothetical protein